MPEWLVWFNVIAVSLGIDTTVKGPRAASLQVLGMSGDMGRCYRKV
ncbi:hypothetical protein LCGC14_2388690 [marine sediment metagenome]|uniref:Uncharacterized protein n=1 Tax=marine sediment metagenome TaxID=412755 RepID=A0A0F9BYX5_9ZZZZ